MKTALAIIVVVLIAAAGYFLFFHKAAAPTPDQGTGTSAAVETTNPAATTSAASTDVQPPGATVTYTDSGFTPFHGVAGVTIKRGQTVLFVNHSSRNMWIASGSHPTHTLYDGTDASEHCKNSAPVSSTTFDECTAVGPGGSWSFTFTKVGAWEYHNHISPNDTGTVVVQ